MVRGPARVAEERQALSQIRTNSAEITARMIQDVKAVYDSYECHPVEPHAHGHDDRAVLDRFKPSFEVGHSAEGHEPRMTSTQARRYALAF